MIGLGLVIGLTMLDIETEGAWLVSLDDRHKLTFLAMLGHSLTIAGRSGYAAQGDGLDQPVLLRRINEIQHRVLACLLEVLTGRSNESFQRSIADWVLRHDDLEMKQLMSWSWNSTKEHLL